MKKIIISVFIGLLCVLGLRAQSSVEYYVYKSDLSNTDYTPLANPTKLPASETVKGKSFRTTLFNATTSKDIEEKAFTMAGIPIGFNFSFDGETYTHFVAAGIGYIVLGNGADGEVNWAGETKGTGQPVQWTLPRLAYDPFPRIGVSAGSVMVGTPVYGVENTSIGYALEGTAPNRILTVEYRNLAYAENATTGLNYQIKLYEADHHIELVFDEFNTGEIGNWAFGIRGRNNKSHFLCPQNMSTKDWAAVRTNGTPASNLKNMAIPKGLKLEFAFGAECEEPGETIKDITLTPFTNQVKVDVDVDSTGEADVYLVIVSENPIEGSPNGKTYLEGDEVLGGTVMGVGELSRFNRPNANQPNSRVHFSFTYPDLRGEPAGFPANKTYYYAVYLGSVKGSNAKYKGMSKSVTTLTSAPSSLKAKRISASEVTFSAEANDRHEDILIAMTTAKNVDPNGNYIHEGFFGIPALDAKVGDTIKVSRKKPNVFPPEMEELYAVVLYVGPAGDDIPSKVDLDDNTLYYFGAASKGNGSYSSLFAQEPVLSPVVLPFDDRFDNMLVGDPRFIGWNGTAGFVKDVNGVIANMAPVNQDTLFREAMLTLPPMDFPGDSNVLLEISYNISSVEFAEGDSIVFEVSTDAGLTFDKIRALTVHSDNKYMQMLVIEGYAGQKQAVIRFRLKSYNEKAWSVSVSRVKVTGIPLCPNPGAARVGHTYGGTLGLTWNQGLYGETEWMFSTAPEAIEGEELAWSRPVMVKKEQQPYYLTGLADQEVYHVRVQAVCGGPVSGWVESTVQAGRVPSFTEDFDHIIFKEEYGGVKPQLPVNWKNGYYPDSYNNSHSWYMGNAKFYQYRTKEAITAESTGYNGSLAFDMQQQRGYVDLLQTPMVELNPAEKPQLTFNAAFGSWVENAFVAMPADNQKDTMHLAMWVCDSGRFDIAAAPAKEWRIAELATWHEGKTITINLSEYVSEPKVVSVVMAVYTEPVAGTEANMLYLDNIGIVNTEPLARSLKVAALSAEAATIQWVADQNVEKWLVKLEGGSLTAPRFFETTGRMQAFDGLEAEKTYTASVTPAANGQVASAERWVSVTFNTPAEHCAEVTDLTVSEITRKSAMLTWQGDAADGYRVRYRPVAAAGAAEVQWVEVDVKGTEYVLNLAMETEYEGGVQAVCNALAGQTSDYVSFENFRTLGLTCFAPTELRIQEQGTRWAKVSWSGTSAAYQVAWSLRGSNVIAGYGEIVTDTFYTVTDLDFGTRYQFKVRGVCAAGDSSEWSETRNFETLPKPACPIPTNLRVEALTQVSATLLWDLEENEDTPSKDFMLRHRAASVQAWDTVRALTETKYELQGLTAKTAYIWAVQTSCTDGTCSGWGTQTRFETLGQDTVPGNDTTAVEDLKLATGLYVAAAQGQIHVMNPKAVRIDNIRIYGLSGQRLEQYAIRSNDNVILTTEVRKRVAVVEVESEGRFIRFKIMLP